MVIRKEEKIIKWRIFECLFIIISIIIITTGSVYIYKIDRKAYHEACRNIDINWIEEDLEYYVISTLVQVDYIDDEGDCFAVEFRVLDRKEHYIAEYKLKHRWFGSYKWEFQRYIQYIPVEEEEG